MSDYHCLGCERPVNADLEPSPREPIYCADCALRREREERIERDWFDDDDPEAA